MRVVRFMSVPELDGLLNGTLLTNHRDHGAGGMKSTSKGFCFAEITPERDANKWWLKLAGIVHGTDIFCVEFEVDEQNNPLTESSATYSHDDIRRIEEKVTLREWCTEQYTIDTMPIVRIGCAPSIASMLLGHTGISWVGNETEFRAACDRVRQQ